jgi:hypothetical protein
MNKHIQIRDVDASTHEKLVQRASAEGLSLSEFLRIELKRMTLHKTNAEIIAEIRQRGPIELGISSEELVRSGREER